MKLTALLSLALALPLAFGSGTLEEFLLNIAFDGNDVALQGQRTVSSSTGGDPGAQPSPGVTQPVAAPDPFTSGLDFTDLQCHLDNPAPGCPGAPAAAPVPTFLSENAFDRLPIRGGAVILQPDRGRALIHVPVLAQSTARAHTLSTTLLGYPITVQVTPVAYTWNFGGGIPPFTTSDPGQPWPRATVQGTYRDVAAHQQVRVTVTWTGQFQVSGMPGYFPVGGTAHTTAWSAPFEVYEAPARLTR